LVEPDSKTEHPFDLAAELLAKMLPSLIAADAEGERRRKGKNERKVYTVTQGKIGIADKSLVFEFVIPTGQEYAFEIDPASAKHLCAALSVALERVETQSGTIETPPRH
jgi:hypothetical protein